MGISVRGISYVNAVIDYRLLEGVHSGYAAGDSNSTTDLEWQNCRIHNISGSMMLPALLANHVLRYSSLFSKRGAARCK